MRAGGSSIRRNLIASVLLGPLRSLVPAILAVLLYPILLHVGGLELVGVWAVLQLIISYLALSTVGLSPLITRKVAAEGYAGTANIGPIRTTLHAYLIGGAILLAVTATCADPFRRLVQLPAEPLMIVVLCTTVLAGVIANVGSLYAAVLSGLHRSYVAQIGETIGAIVQFVVAGTVVLLGQHSLGLAIGLLLGKTTTLVMLSAAVRGQAPEYLVVRPWPRRHDFARLLAEARGFISLNVGGFLLEPLVRALLAVMAGPSELAVFDLANRLPMLLRNTFTNGLMALLPAVTAFRVQQRPAAIGRLLRTSLGIVVLLAVTPLAAYLMLAKPLLFLWLGDVALRVSTITLVTTAWWTVTSYNIPFYLTMQALGLEQVVSRSVWLHIVLVLLGTAVLHEIGVNAMNISLLVLAAGVISQVQLYIEIQGRAQLLSIAFSDRRDCLMAVASLVLLAGAVLLRVDATGIAVRPGQMLVDLAVFLAIWMVILRLFADGRSLRFLFRTARQALNVDDVPSGPRLLLPRA